MRTTSSSLKTEELIIKLFGSQPESIEERRLIEDRIYVLEMGNKLEETNL